MNILLECRDISKSYRLGSVWSRKGYKDIIKNISFSVYEGRSLGIVGKNGSGKSTITRLMLALEKADSGDVFFAGESINALLERGDNSFRKNISVVFQDPTNTLNPRFSAYDAIVEPLNNFYSLSREELQAKVYEVAIMVGLKPEMLNKRCGQFSGGEQQRISIARALILSPKLLILDEALSNLDMLLQVQIIDMLKDIRKKTGVTYIIISHDMRVIFQLCSDIIVIDDGKITENLSIENGLSGVHSDIFKSLVTAIKI